MPGVRAAFVFSLKLFVQTHITYVTVERFVLASSTNPTLVTMKGTILHAGEQLAYPTKIVR